MYMYVIYCIHTRIHLCVCVRVCVCMYIYMQTRAHRIRQEDEAVIRVSRIRNTQHTSSLRPHPLEA